MSCTVSAEPSPVLRIQKRGWSSGYNAGRKMREFDPSRQGAQVLLRGRYISLTSRGISNSHVRRTRNEYASCGRLKWRHCICATRPQSFKKSHTVPVSSKAKPRIRRLRLTPLPRPGPGNGGRPAFLNKASSSARSGQPHLCRMGRPSTSRPRRRMAHGSYAAIHARTRFPSI